MASTPEEALAIPVKSSKKNVNTAAFGNIVRGEYSVHMVNNGADCHAVITGLPKEITRAKVYVTKTQDSMVESEVTVEDGQFNVYLPAVSFVTVLAE